MDYISILQAAFLPEVIIFVLFGVIIGLTFGAIPGLSGDIGIALMLPFVYKLPPVQALGLLLGIYKASMFGGAISAISFGVPGTGAAVVTLLDGYPAQKKGYPRKALLTALYSSATGDFFAVSVLVFVAIPLSMIALKFGPKEYFALYFFALLTISLLLRGVGVGGNTKGIVAAFIGLLLGQIGRDPLVGTTRLTFGINRLRGGIPLIPLLVGIFAVSELMIQFLKAWYLKRSKNIKESSGLFGGSSYDPSKDVMNFKVYLSTLKATLIGCVMGTFVGALPGAGSSLATFVSYGAAKQFSSHPEQFGKGSLEGIAAPEAGNNATVASSLIPLIAFGIPGSATAALIGAAFMLMGMMPGPLMIQQNKPVMMTFFVVIFYAGAMMLGMGYLLIPFYTKISLIKPRFLYPSVFLLAVLGTYVSNNSVIDIWLLLAAGLLGVLLRKGGFPLGPLVLAYILGPGAEKSLRQALLIGGGDWSVLLKSPIAIGFYAISVVSTVFLIMAQKKKV